MKSKWTTSRGAVVLVEENHELPLVDLHLCLRTGTTADPPHLAGLTRMTWRMVRMGTRKMKSPEVEEAIARLGGRLTTEVGSSFVRIHGTVIRRNLERFVELVMDLLVNPAFRTSDLAQVKRETLAEIIALRDSDKALAGKHFRARLYGSHPYGRSVLGTAASVRAIDTDAIARHYKQHFRAKNLIVGISGDVEATVVRDAGGLLVDEVPAGDAPRTKLPAPKMRPGVHLRIVDKPERTQTQILAGTLGSRLDDSDYDALSLANTVFGGSFTARLMQEIRVKRGWSYGAYSRLGQDRQREAWYMWTFPAAKDAPACLALELKLLKTFVDRGIGAREHRFARDYLIHGHCFERDTPAKRLDARVDVELFNLPPDYHDTYEERMGAVTRDQANDAVRRRLSANGLAIAVVATASSARAPLSKIPSLDSIEVVPFDQD